jgi:hypothetical protein
MLLGERNHFLAGHLRIDLRSHNRLSAFGYRLSAIGFRLSAFGYRLSAIGYRLPGLVNATRLASAIRR